MIVRKQVSHGIWLEEDVSTEAEAFKTIARMTEIFDQPKCGKCNGEHVKFVCRKDSEENDWLEIVCQNKSCRHKLVYGATKKGGEVYPKTRWSLLSETQQETRADEKEYADSHNGWLPNGGWFLYKHPAN